MRSTLVPCTFLAAMLCVGTTSRAQQPASPTTPSDADVLTAARAIMGTARYAALITVGPDGHPQARTVDAFAPDSAMVVWIATNVRSRKVEQIRRDPRVTLYYFDPADPGYVTLLGRARVVTEPAEKARRWKEDWVTFYADRNRGADYALLEVRPLRVEVVSTKHRIENDPRTWTPRSVRVR